MSLAAQLRELPRPFWILVGATFVNRFGVFVVPFLALFMTRNGSSPAQAGWAVAAYSLGGFAAAGLGGWMADRLGRNVTMALAAIGGASCMLVLSQMTDWRALTLLAFLTGAVSEAGHPAGVALVQDLVPPERRILAFAVQRWAVNLGWSFGPATAGFLAEHSFFWLFLIDAATSIVFGVVAWILLPRGRRTSVEEAGWSHAWRSIRKNRPFLSLFGACVCVAWIFRQTNTTFPLHFEKNGLPLRHCGLVLAMNGILICLFEVPVASALRRWPVRQVLAGGYVLMGTSYLAFLGGGTLAVFVAMMAVFSLGEMLAFSRQQAHSASLAPEAMRGRYVGFLSLAWCAGNTMSAAFGMAIYGKDPAAAWIVNALLGFGAASVILATGRKRDPDPVEIVAGSQRGSST